jgi:hypothetical protein
MNGRNNAMKYDRIEGLIGDSKGGIPGIRAWPKEREEVLRPSTRMIFIAPPSDPCLNVIDIRMLGGAILGPQDVIEDITQAL